MLIKTNKLKAKINYATFQSCYDIFIVKTSEKYFSRGAYIIDAPLLCDNVLSVYFESGSSFYVLMKKNNISKLSLKKVIEESEGGENVTISVVLANEVKDYILVQLLMNSLINYELDFMKFNNLTGHLYCFNPKWLKKEKFGKQMLISRVPCLELRVSNEMNLIMKVHTFTSELLRSRITFKKKKFEYYPKYVFSANNTLRRKISNDTENSLIKRQIDGVKTDIPFLDIQSKEKFDTSKMGVIVNFMNLFNNKFHDICDIEFDIIDNYISLEHTRAIAKENKQAIDRILLKNSINIVDEIGDDYSSIFCNDLKTKLWEKYSVPSTISTKPKKNYLNICLIHNNAYYNGKDDPHTLKWDGYTIQHITFEDFVENIEYALSTIIHEMIIKNDIQNGNISLFDWTKLGILEDISFGMRIKDEDISRYFFMKIKPDGNFYFEEQKLNLFEMSEYSDCVDIFENNTTVKGIVKRSNSDINLISDTDWITIPEIEDISEELSKGNTKLRGKEKRNELLQAILDIKFFNRDNSKYYFVGIIGEGMRAKVANAANIRKISSYKGAQLMFDDLLPLMNVTFVHNGQLTIMPFPFKYLREYAGNKI